MRAILANLRSGEVTGHEVPQPELRPGGILVRTALSAISAGTERAYREQVEKSLLGKAPARPDLVRQVADFARTAGVRAAYGDNQSSDGKTRRDKGNEGEIAATVEAMRSGGNSPIPFTELMEVSEATLAIEAATASGTVSSLASL